MWRWLWLLFVGVGWCHELQGASVVSILDSAKLALDAGDFQKSIDLLQLALRNDRDNIEANHLLGTLYIKFGEPELGLPFLNSSLALSEFQDAFIVANYMEGLRMCGFHDVASEIGRLALEKYNLTSSFLFYNYAIIEEQRGDIFHALELYKAAIQLNPLEDKCWKNLIELTIEKLKQYSEAEAMSRKALSLFASPQFYFLLGTSLQHLNRFDEAVDVFLICLELQPNYYAAKSSLGAAYQVLGKAELALHAYESAMPFKDADAAIRNNYGALLGVMNDKEGEIAWLKEALAIEPTMSHALINLGGYYQDEGVLTEARGYLQRASEQEPGNLMLKLRLLMLMPPVCISWAEMIMHRNSVEKALTEYVTMQSESAVKNELDASMDRIHFYIVYHGVNDRPFQELVQKAYQNSISSFGRITRGLPSSIESIVQKTVAQGKLVRVGFLSKFFGIFEPHGLLLDGVMRYLPRDIFEVFALPVARTDSKPVAPSITDAADHVIEVSLKHQHALAMLDSLQLDILIFADTMSEPMSHFLAHNRMAPIQCAFWGNPVTSASLHIDYFMSSDSLEHPFRNRMLRSHEPYTEQVVLLQGQGIWYHRPEPPRLTIKKTNIYLPLAPDEVFTKASFNLSQDSFVYFCPQSVFKMHPLFDQVFVEILRRNPRGEIVVTGGRRPRWTNLYAHRLTHAMGGENSTLLRRLHLIPRVSSEKFIALLNIADVILHPFPFDGSRTSADGLIAGVPVLTLPTEYLRGRMGAAFLRTMNISELVAKNQSHYVQIAVRLCEDVNFYQDIKARIVSNVDLIWEDMEQPYAWTQFLSKIVGLPPIHWKRFLESTGRDVEYEAARQLQRERNRMAFDTTWGSEIWLLKNGVAVLETSLDADHYPRIFNDWVTVDPASSPPAPTVPVYYENSYVPLAGHVVDIFSRSRKPGQHLVASKLVSIETPTLFIPAGISTQTDAAKLETVRSLVHRGMIEDANQVASTMLPSHQLDATFLLEFGSLQVFRSDYQSALKYCKRVVAIVPDAFLAHVCIGVASMYLNLPDESIPAFVTAWRLLKNNVTKTVPSSIFVVTEDALEFNFITALRTFRKFDDCLTLGAFLTDIPVMTEGGAYILLFSLVDWTPARVRELPWIEDVLQRKGILRLQNGRTFREEIFRLQRDYKHIMNPFTECLMDGVTAESRQVLIKDLQSFVERSSVKPPLNFLRDMSLLERAGASNLVLRESYLKSGLALITQHFRTNNAAVLRDMSNALQLNLDNPLISEVYLLNEESFDYSSFRNSWKIHEVVIGRRLLFSDAFEFSTRYISNRTVAIANADIFFDNSLGLLGNASTLKLGKVVLSLVKWSQRNDGELYFSLRTNSQDAWIFQTPVDSRVIPFLGFHIGRARCDNRLARVLENSGFTLQNPGFALHAIEIHSTERRGPLYDMKGSVLGETSEVLLSDRFIF